MKLRIFEHYVLEITLSKIFGESDLVVFFSQPLELSLVLTEELVIKRCCRLLFGLGWTLELLLTMLGA